VQQAGVVRHGQVEHNVAALDERDVLDAQALRALHERGADGQAAIVDKVGAGQHDRGHARVLGVAGRIEAHVRQRHGAVVGQVERARRVDA
jgi:hypothetical protein